MAEYSALVIEHFERPRNFGWLAAAADVTQATAGKPADGVQFSLSAHIAAGAIVAVRVQAFGCPHCIAAASWASERLVGMTRSQLLEWQWREAATALDVPTEKRGRLLVLEDAVRALGRGWTT